MMPALAINPAGGEAYDIVRQSIRSQQARQTDLYDDKIFGASYHIGDLVWLHTSAVKSGLLSQTKSSLVRTLQSVGRHFGCDLSYPASPQQKEKDCSLQQI